MEQSNGMLWFVLDDRSQANLRSSCPAQFPRAFGDHATLRFDVPLSAAYEKLVGKPHTIEVYEHCWNNRVQAVRVRTNGLPDQYGVPHVTVSAVGEPFESVAMLKGSHHSEPLSLTLNGTVKFIPLKSRR